MSHVTFGPLLSNSGIRPKTLTMRLLGWRWTGCPSYSIEMVLHIEAFCYIPGLPLPIRSFRSGLSDFFGCIKSVPDKVWHLAFCNFRSTWWTSPEMAPVYAWSRRQSKSSHGPKNSVFEICLPLVFEHISYTPKWHKNTKIHHFVTVPSGTWKLRWPKMSHFGMSQWHIWDDNGVYSYAFGIFWDMVTNYLSDITLGPLKNDGFGVSEWQFWVMTLPRGIPFGSFLIKNHHFWQNSDQKIAV